MRIENHGPEYDKSIRLDVTSDLDEARRNAPAAAKREVRDQASFSEQARLLSQAHAALDEVPEVREARVAALQAEIEGGTYKVPVEALTRHLISKVA